MATAAIVLPGDKAVLTDDLPSSLTNHAYPKGTVFNVRKFVPADPSTGDVAYYMLGDDFDHRGFAVDASIVAPAPAPATKQEVVETLLDVLPESFYSVHEHDTRDDALVFDLNLGDGRWAKVTVVVAEVDHP